MADFNGGQAAQGAMGGAMAGSFAGPIGMGIGALAGGALGGFFGGGEDPNQKYRDMLEQYSRRKGPSMGPAAQAGRSGLQGNRASLVAQLEAMARGEGPSAAALQMQDAMERASASQASAAAGAGGRGVNQGAAQRNAMNNTAAVQAQMARDTGTIRAQEQMTAVGQLGQVVGQGISSDNQHSQFNAGQLNQHQIAQLQAIGIHNQQQLDAIMGAMGGTPKPQPGMGTQLLAGGAQAFMPGLQHWQGGGGQQMPQMGGFGGSWGGNGRLGGGAGGFGMSPSGVSPFTPQAPSWSGPPPQYPTYNPYGG